MNELQLQAYRDRLIKMREEIESLASTTSEAAQTVELDQTRQGRLSRMDALQGQAMSQEAKRRRELELIRIATALQRIEQGNYGVCVKCAEDIAEGRLHADPATPVCIDCAR